MHDAAAREGDDIAACEDAAERTGRDRTIKRATGHAGIGESSAASSEEVRDPRSEAQVVGPHLERLHHRLDDRDLDDHLLDRANNEPRHILEALAYGLRAVDDVGEPGRQLTGDRRRQPAQGLIGAEPLRFDATEGRGDIRIAALELLRDLDIIG